MEANIVAVSISKPAQQEYYGQPASQHFSLVPFYSHTDNWRDIDREASSLEEKLQYRADRRNLAVTIALEQYPDSTDIMMIDSWYLTQGGILWRLIQRYKILKNSVSLGPAIWGRMRTNLSQIPGYHLNRQRFYDAWATPELRWCPRGWRPEKDMLTRQEHVPLRGLYRVSSIGGCYIFPRSIWEKGARYGVPYDLHGCEHNYFHASHELPKYIDFTVELKRVKKYGLVHCARCSIGNWWQSRSS